MNGSSSLYSEKSEGGVSRNRYPQPNSDNYLLTDVRSALEQQQKAQAGSSSASSRRQSRNPFGPESLSDEEGGDGSDSDDDIIWELERLVGEDPDEVLEGDERTKRRSSRLGARGLRSSEAYYEITEQVTELVTETQTVEHYNLSDPQQRLSSQGAASRSSQPSSSLSTNLQKAVLLEDEWVEVENAVSPATDADGQPSEFTSSSPMQLIASSPNGSVENPTVASAAFQDALDHPQQNSARVQVILKTTIKKLLEKKRVVKRVHPELPGRSSQKQDPRSVSWDEEEAEEVEDMMGGAETSSESFPGLPRSIAAPPSLALHAVNAHAPPPAAGSSPNPPGSPKFRSTTSPLRPSYIPRSAFKEDDGVRADGKKHGSFSRAISKAKSSFSGKSSPPSSQASTPTKTSPRAIPSAARNLGASAGPSRSSSSLPTREASLHPTRSSSPVRTTARHPLFVPPSSDSASSDSSPSVHQLHSAPPISSASTARTKPSQRPSSPDNSSPHPDGSSRHRVPPKSAANPKRKAPRARQPSTTTSTRSVFTQQSQFQTTTQAGPSSDESHLNGLFPRDHLVKNIHKFCRYSSAAYGQNFLRILGLGATEFMFPTTGRHHANSWGESRRISSPSSVCAGTH